MSTNISHTGENINIIYFIVGIGDKQKLGICFRGQNNLNLRVFKTSIYIFKGNRKSITIEFSSIFSKCDIDFNVLNLLYVFRLKNIPLPSLSYSGNAINW